MQILLGIIGFQFDVGHRNIADQNFLKDCPWYLLQSSDVPVGRWCLWNWLFLILILKLIVSDICCNHLMFMKSHLSSNPSQSPAYGFWDEFRLRAFGCKMPAMLNQSLFTFEKKGKLEKRFIENTPLWFSDNFSRIALEPGLSWVGCWIM